MFPCSQRWSKDCYIYELKAVYTFRFFLIEVDDYTRHFNDIIEYILLTNCFKASLKVKGILHHERFGQQKKNSIKKYFKGLFYETLFFNVYFYYTFNLALNDPQEVEEPLDTINQSTILFL